MVKKNNMKYLMLFFVIFIHDICVSQHKKIIYVDENYKEINFLTYKKKLQSNLFDIAKVENDTALFKKLRFIEFYGVLKPKIKSQLAKLFNKKYNIDTTKIWLIHYVDFMPNLEKMPEKSGVELLDSLYNPTGIFLNDKEFKKRKCSKARHKHITSAKDYISQIDKESREVKNKKVSLLHFYGTNKGFPEEIIKKYNYFQDYKDLIKKLFNDKMKNFSVIILYPNREFYISNFYVGNLKLEKKLVRKSYYNRKKKLWQKRLSKLNKTE